MTRTLTDDQLAEIAWAGPDETSAALARRVGSGYFGVAQARARMRKAGGWWCVLDLRVCAECGRPMLAGRNSRRRIIHRGCVIRRKAWRDHRYRVEHRPGCTSTPYTRAWRERHPDHWVSLPIEERAARLERRTRQKAESQVLSLQDAWHRGAPWTPDDDVRVLAHSIADLALARELGRSMYAVQGRRAVLRQRAQRDVATPG